MAGKSTNPRKFTMNIYYGDESKKYIDEFFKYMARIKVDAIMDEMERQKLSKEEKIKVLNQLIEEESKKEHKSNLFKDTDMIKWIKID